LVCIFSIIVISIVIAQGPEKKVWNDGNVDYVPLGTKIRLESADINSDAGIIFYTHNFSEAIPYEGPIKLDVEGEVWFSYGTQDAFGSISNLQTYTAIVDGSAPVLKYLTDGPFYFDNNGVFYFSSKTGFLVYGEDSYSGTEHIYIKINDEEYQDFAEEGFLALYDVPDGEYYIEGYLVDYVGNASDITGAYAYLDNTPPELQAVITPKPIEIDGNIYVDPRAVFSINASDDLSGIKEVYVSLNGSEFARYELDSQIPFRGDHDLRVYAVDNVGNTSDVAQLDFSNILVLSPPELYLELE